MKRNSNDEMVKNAYKVAKRIAITVVSTIPFLIVFAYLMRNIITSDALQIASFVLILGVVVLIVEIIARAREKKKKEIEILEDKKDVFK